jgi:hypothetical protein
MKFSHTKIYDLLLKHKLFPRPIYMMLKVLAAYLTFLKIIARRKKILSIYLVALPKSGSSWVEQLLSNVTGLSIYTPYQDIFQEVVNRGKLDYTFKKSYFMLRDKGSVIKTHTTRFPSELLSNSSELKGHIGLVRAPLDVVRSYLFHVSNDHYHPRNPLYKKADCIEQMLDVFFRHDYVDFLKAYEFYRRISRAGLFPVFDYNMLLGRESAFISLLVERNIISSADKQNFCIERNLSVKFGSKIFGENNTIDRNAVHLHVINFYSKEIDLLLLNYKSIKFSLIGDLK